MRRTLIGIVCVASLLLAGCSALNSLKTLVVPGTPNPESTLNVPPLVISPSATPIRVALSQMTKSYYSEPMLTLTAFNAQILGTFEHRPTPTAGPSAIVLNGKPHFVEFNATWCAPCQQMKPSVAAMKAKYGDQITFWSIDIDNIGSTRLVHQYQVQFIPLSVLLDKDGRTVTMLEGYQEEQQLDTALQALLSAGTTAN